MAALGIVTGLKSEARLALAAALKAGLATGVVEIECAGPGLYRAAAAAQRLIGKGARSLLSFGVAGALKAGLEPGTIVLPRTVFQEGAAPIDVDDLRADLICLALAATGPIERGALISTRDVVTSPTQKRTLAEAGGAVAVDMESYAVGAVAQAAGVSFAALRVVADPATRAIPPSAMAGMSREGDVRPVKVLQMLARRPMDLPELIRLGRDNAKAMASLGRAARLALPLLLIGR